MQKMTLKAAQEIAGKVSVKNSKMPGSSFAISATVCKTGSKLAEVEGSVCHRCYALKLEKLRPSVHKGWMGNYLKAVKMIEQAPEQWAQAVAFQIRKAAEKTGEKFHRWFDSGDLQSVAMLKAICLAAEKTPEIKHWLPTREAGILRDFLKEGGEIPENLTIRLSATKIDGNPPKRFASLAGVATSTVHKYTKPEGHICPASKQGNQCGDCRACWDRNIRNVSYPLH